MQSSIKEELLEIPQIISKKANKSQGEAEATATIRQDVIMDNITPHMVLGAEEEKVVVVLS